MSISSAREDLEANGAEGSQLFVAELGKIRPDWPDLFRPAVFPSNDTLRFLSLAEHLFAEPDHHGGILTHHSARVLHAAQPDLAGAPAAIVNCPKSRVFGFPVVDRLQSTWKWSAISRSVLPQEQRLANSSRLMASLGRPPATSWRISAPICWSVRPAVIASNCWCVRRM
jgi:hypothetical protein